MGRSGGIIAQPVPTNLPQAKYSREAKNKHIQGICLIGLIVDVNGMPQNIHVVHSLESSLDQNAIEAVRAYRFKPAMKDCTTPVPVYINIEVSFRLY
jgi:TonB family protein